MKILLIFWIVLCSFQLHAQVASEQFTSFKKLKCGLYINHAGDIGFKSSVLVDDQGNREILYQTHVWLEDEREKYIEQPVSFKHVVDTASFEILNTFYARDKNYVYAIFYTSSGAVFNGTKQINPLSFRVFDDSSYGADNHQIYYRTEIMKMADYRTFTAIKGTGNIAYDKNNYYLSGETLSPEDARTMGYKKN